jgi:hypothetical protein
MSATSRCCIRQIPRMSVTVVISPYGPRGKAKVADRAAASRAALDVSSFARLSGSEAFGSEVVGTSLAAASSRDLWVDPPPGCGVPVLGEHCPKQALNPQPGMSGRWCPLPRGADQGDASGQRPGMGNHLGLDGGLGRPGQRVVGARGPVGRDEQDGRLVGRGVFLALRPPRSANTVFREARMTPVL